MKKHNFLWRWWHSFMIGDLCQECKDSLIVILLDTVTGAVTFECLECGNKQ